MSSTVNQSTWEMINATSYEVQESAKAQKQGQARIAQSNHSQGKQKVAKDVIIPSAGDELGGKIGKGSKGEAKPQIPTPKAKFAGLKGDDVDESGEPQNGKTLGLIAIIGEVMALQAKSNSNFWSTLWKQAFQSMTMEVKFAPIIGDAIKSAYTAQSEATQADANMSKEDGIISLVMFGGSMLMAGVSEFSSEAEADNDLKTEDETALENGGGEGTDPEGGIEMDSLNEEEQSAQQTENDVNRTVNREESSWKSRAKRYLKFVKDVGGRSQTKLGNILGKGMQYAMGADMLSRGITGYFVDSKYKSQMAAKQGEEGQAQALSKEAEQYAQFYGQSFSRSDSMAQGTQQNLDYAMNILKSAADTITQTVTSMFRG